MIRINRVSGYDPTPNGPPARIVVYGVASPDSVDQLDSVQLEWAANRQSDPVQAAVNDGAFTAEFHRGTHFPGDVLACSASVWVVTGGFKNPVADYVICETEPTCPVFKQIDPSHITQGDCDTNGLIPVTIDVRLNPGQQLVEGELLVWSLDENNEWTRDLTWPPGQESALTQPPLRLPGGARYMAQASSGPGCYGPATEFRTPGCGCPDVMLTPPAVTHLDGGYMRVEVSALLTPQPGAHVSAKLLIVDASTEAQVGPEVDSVTQTTTPVQLGGTVDNLPPGSYKAKLHITDPLTCGDVVSETFGGAYAITDIVVIPNLRLCPMVTLQDARVETGDCQDGKRTVHGSAEITAFEDPVDATLELQGSTTQVLSSLTGQTGTFTLAGSVDAEPGEYNLVVTIAAPGGCPGKSKPVTVPACENGGGGGGGVTLPQIDWCAVLAFLAIGLIAVGGVIAAVAFCILSWADVIMYVLVAAGAVSSGSTSTVAAVLVIVLIVIMYIGLIILSVGMILFFIWLLICGSCRTNCRLLWNVLHALIAIAAVWAIITVISGIVAMIIAAIFPPLGGTRIFCSLFWAIETVNWVFLIALVSWWGGMAGCWDFPDWLPRFLRWRLPDWLTGICGGGLRLVPRIPRTPTAPDVRRPIG